MKYTKKQLFQVFPMGAVVHWWDEVIQDKLVYGVVSGYSKDSEDNTVLKVEVIQNQGNVQNYPQFIFLNPYNKNIDVTNVVTGLKLDEDY